MSGITEIVSLGGCGGFGMNATLFGSGDSAILVDFGIGFPRDVLPGAARVVPDPTPLVDRWPRLDAIVITHAHDDHAGALAYLPDAWGAAPVHGTPLALGVAEERWGSVRKGRPRTERMQPGWTFEAGPFSVTPIHVTHSVPESCALRLDTPGGTIVHTGDFKLDDHPLRAPGPDYEAFGRAARDGVDLLLLDSTGSVTEGPSRPERVAAATLEELIAGAPRQALVSIFSTHIDRLDALCRIAHRTGRHVGLVGRRLQSMARRGLDLGHLTPKPDVLVGPASLEALPPASRLVVASGCQGEPESAMGRLSNGAHPSIQLGEDDLVLLSARTIPGNELSVARLVDRLLRLGTRVVTAHERPDLHASGHGTRGDMERLVDLLAPRAVVPIHGDRAHLVLAAELAERCRRAPRQVEIVERGEYLQLSGNGLARGPAVDLPPRLVDDAGRTIRRDAMRQRRRTATSGAALISIRADGRGGDTIDVTTLGLAGDAAALEAEAAARVREILGGTRAPRDARLAETIERRVARALSGGRSLPRPVVRVAFHDEEETR